MVNACDEVKGDAMLSVSVSTMNLVDDGEDDSFAGELLDLKALVDKMSKKGIDVAPYYDDDTDAYHCLDPADPDWRETVLD